MILLLITSLQLYASAHAIDSVPPLPFWAIAHLCARRFDEAVSKLLVAIQDNPGLPWPYRALASSYAHLGRLEEARHTVDRIRALAAVVVPSHLPWRNPERRELFLSGLHLA